MSVMQPSATVFLRVARTPLLALLPACADPAPADPAAASGAGITTAGATAATDTDGSAPDGEGSTAGDTAAESSGECPGCGDGLCIEDVCCPIDAACGDVCCGDGDVCSFGACVEIGDPCIDQSECPAGYCEYALGEPAGDGGDDPACQGGASLATGRCLPSPPDCALGEIPDVDAPDCLPQCEVHPTPSFTPTLKYHWDVANVMMTPIVVQLDDDDCSGVVDERDLPELVVSTFVGNAYGSAGSIVALSVEDGALIEKWTITPSAEGIAPGRALAAGNIDGIPGNEIVACTTSGRARAFGADGTPLWQSGPAACGQPSIADLDQDGAPEVLTDRAVIDGATGTIEFLVAGSGSDWWRETMLAADITGDGRLDLVKPGRAFDATGAALVTGAPAGNFPAVADLDLDGRAEVIAIRNTGGDNLHHLSIWRYDAAAPGGFVTIRAGVDINGTIPTSHCPADYHGRFSGGGPPVVADFDGDGVPDVGVAGGVGYAVFDGAKLMDPDVANADTLLWIRETQDCSSAFTGSSVFDFDGDGSAEVVYADEEMLRIYRGIDGEILYETCNTSGTLHEYPVVADVDNDAHADLVVVSNDYSYLECPIDGSKTRGVRIFGDDEGRWVRTRRVWNQHAYHVTNVEEDGSIPAVEVANWSVPGLNNFRQNVQPAGEFSAPDLVPQLRVECAPEAYSLVGRIRNLGRASVPAGVRVDFYAGDPDAGGLLGTAMTTKVLYPAEAEDVVLTLDAAPQELADGSAQAWVVVDDTDLAHPWQECRVDNNRATGPGPCMIAG
jgi:hypothetical protein